jgi:hypothetical protein
MVIYFFIKYVFKFHIYIMISPKYFAHPQYLILHKKKLEVILSTKEKHVKKKDEKYTSD